MEAGVVRGTGRAFVHRMRLLLIAGFLVLAACSGGESHETTKTTDTTVTPTRATDTTVVQKNTEVSVDTVKKTHHKKP